ncbi:PAS domain-containing protein [Dethiosulfatarculus sandiegensis]|uniref:PAS domain-containing protein n=1 Tax=Dethiosulfatarculus sandiegensis TaxID=1429043 RepID=A0A0D2J272_9BACT|nr:PAS domain-containing protein [Dethiosulfatarculus sandiegensis]KIX12334.1 hypothetical protein X474_20870 [Dethiosulfatarculus sandiegensis]
MPLPDPGLKQALWEAAEQMPVALSIIDLEGNLVYYNEYATKILERKPSLLGKNIRNCHKLKTSNQKIDSILNQYRQGSLQEHTWSVARDGKRFSIRVAPLIQKGETKGLIHTAMLLGPDFD